jgi:hypothetical protein
MVLSHSLARLERIRSGLPPHRGAELEPPRPDIALPVLAGERRAATLTPRCAQGADVNAAAWPLIFFFRPHRAARLKPIHLKDRGPRSPMTHYFKHITTELANYPQCLRSFVSSQPWPKSSGIPW